MPTAPRPRQRHRKTDRRFRFVRLVGGGAVQARPKYGPGKTDCLNLGLFHPRDYCGLGGAYRAAQRASFEFIKRAAGGRGHWDVIRELQQTVIDGRPVVPPSVLPKWVYRHKDGPGYGARAGKGSTVPHLPGPFADPAAAHRAMKAHLEGLRRGRTA